MGRIDLEAARWTSAFRRISNPGRDAAIRFAREELAPDLDLEARDEARTFWREGWERCARFGLQGLPIPTEYGGRGLGLPATIAAMEGLGYACPR